MSNSGLLDTLLNGNDLEEQQELGEDLDLERVAGAQD